MSDVILVVSDTYDIMIKDPNYIIYGGWFTNYSKIWLNKCDFIEYNELYTVASCHREIKKNIFDIRTINYSKYFVEPPKDDEQLCYKVFQQRETKKFCLCEMRLKKTYHKSGTVYDASDMNYKDFGKEYTIVVFEDYPKYELEQICQNKTDFIKQAFQEFTIKEQNITLVTELKTAIPDKVKKYEAELLKDYETKLTKANEEYKTQLELFEKINKEFKYFSEPITFDFIKKEHKELIDKEEYEKATRDLENLKKEHEEFQKEFLKRTASYSEKYTKCIETIMKTKPKN